MGLDVGLLVLKLNIILVIVNSSSARGGNVRRLYKQWVISCLGAGIRVLFYFIYFNSLDNTIL